MYIIRLEEIDSTNFYAKSKLAEFADKTVISAEKQTAGHGRFDRAWVDLGRDNIFMSIILKPSNSFKSVYANITQYFSVILCRVLDRYGVEAKIKWPNDVLVNGKKIAGILSETVVQGQNFKGLILGAGINLNSNTQDLANITDKEATALNLEINAAVDKDCFFNTLLESFFEDYDKFLDAGFELILDDYVARACFLGKEISVKGFNDTFSGFAKSVNSRGELVLENNNVENIITMGDIL